MPIASLLRIAAALAGLALCFSADAADSGAIDFDKQIRPILSDNCYACHGPDEHQRKAGLRLDRKESAFRELKSGKKAVVAGKADESALVARILSSDPDEKMPPPDFKKKLNASQIDLLRRWVESGAQWKEHWAYVAPERPALPEVQDKSWPKNEIDRFVLARLEKEGFKPSPEADKPALIRRATLDLTGLPPTVEEIDAFLADNSPDAYEKVVDRLLDAEQYGERMAQNWLDLARYADTSGYHFDGLRFMWPWRDWVINAFNKNMPFDQFTIEQLAGDLLPNPTVAQRIATGFHRNVMTNDEGGADPDEYLSKYQVDRVNTTGAVWLGTTTGCAECHDHKYDPLTQRDFYQLYSFFHNIPEKGLDGTRVENPFPRLSVPSPEQATDLVELDRAVDDAERTVNDRARELPAAQARWEKEVGGKSLAAAPTNGLAVSFSFDDGAAYLDAGGARHETKLEGSSSFAPGRPGKALDLNGQKQFIDAGNPITFDRQNAFSYGGWVYSRGNHGAVLSRMDEADKSRGVDLLLTDGAFEAHLVNQWPDNAIKLRTRKTFPKDAWLHVFVTYNGSSKASGVQIYVNGVEQDLEIQKDTLSGSIAANTPLRIGARSNSAFFNGLLDEIRIYERALSKDEVLALELQSYGPILAIPADRRTGAELEDLRQLYRSTYASDYRAAEEALTAARSRKADLLRRIPNTMVMREMDKPRDTFILVRGDFQRRSEKVSANVPSFLPALKPDEPRNRLGLARWLMSKEHPLTSRVTVNRYWAMFFGTGLVKTVNDFGSQSEPPSHPQLLDWLACQFRDGDVNPAAARAVSRAPAKPWDTKALVRQIVTSATYRQGAAVTPALLERDPYNRLLTRGPRLRLEAEFIRDHALAVSGLLNRKIGGPSVKPYQPAGLWDVTDTQYDQSHGPDLYRRGMYVYWKRAVHYPSFATFDAPSREVCTAQRPRTSTPLQSFVLMNDPVYLECARAFAARTLREGGKEPEDRLVFAFRTTLARRPSSQEISILLRTLREMQSLYAQNSEGAEDLLKTGESDLPPDISKTELAAYTCVANVLLNLNEAISN